jgi:hypothetical protein
MPASMINRVADGAYQHTAKGTCPTTMSTGDLPKAIDLSHHLSDVAKARAPSPLKDLAKYFGTPGLISLAGGLYR